jgi:hypothetical protein
VYLAGGKRRRISEWGVYRRGVNKKDKGVDARARVG